MSRFLNPYNFVQPLPEPNLGDFTPEKRDTYLLWRCPPPPHDRYTGLTGSIECTLTAQTPLFTSDSDPLDSKAEHREYQFFNVNGHDLIPGSSLRGPIRSVFEAVTNSTFGVSDRRMTGYFHRMLPEEALGMVPGVIVKKQDGGWQVRLLSGFDNVEADSQNLYAAWIPKYSNELIKEKAEKKRSERAKQGVLKHQLTHDDFAQMPQKIKRGKAYHAAVSKNYRRKGFPHHQADYIHEDKQTVEKWAKRQNQGHLVVRGYIHITDLNADVKQYERFFFEYNERPIDLPLTDDMIETYDAMMRDYHDRREEIANSLKSQSEGRRKGIRPSNFIRGKSPRTLRAGTTVYVRLSGHSGNFKVEGLYPVGIPRKAYRNTANDLLKKHAPYLLPSTDYNRLSLADRVFGWVSQEEDDPNVSSDLSKQVAYQGRVRFTHAEPHKNQKKLGKMKLSILGSPKPTTVEFYLKGAELPKVRGNYGYDTNGAKLRGRKIYRHHKWFNKAEATTESSSNQNRTIEGAYDKGSMFTFTIYFENMQPVELGALFWTLKLEQGDWNGFHRVGYGKPLGFGSARVTVNTVNATDMVKCATGDDATSIVSTDEITGWIEVFRKGMTKLYGKDFNQLGNVQDLMALLGERDDDLPIHYPRPKADPNAENNEGFKWFDNNKRKDSLKPASQDDGFTY